MKKQVFSETEREEWLAFRRGKITGSKLAGLYSKRDTGKRKIGFYDLIAERLGVPPDTDENSMERGSRLESEALEVFSKAVGKKVDGAKQVWMRDDNEAIAVTPDGVLPKNEAVEVKCLSSARHVEAYITKKIPADYYEQAVQYFVVNEKLKKLYFAFYDPRFALFGAEGKIAVDESPNAKLAFFYLELKREDIEQNIADYLEFEKTILAEVDEIVSELTF